MFPPLFSISHTQTVRPLNQKPEEDSCLCPTAKVALPILASLASFVFLPIEFAFVFTAAVVVGALLMGDCCSSDTLKGVGGALSSMRQQERVDPPPSSSSSSSTPIPVPSSRTHARTSTSPSPTPVPVPSASTGASSTSWLPPQSIPPRVSGRFDSAGSRPAEQEEVDRRGSSAMNAIPLFSSGSRPLPPTHRPSPRPYESGPVDRHISDFLSDHRAFLSNPFGAQPPVGRPFPSSSSGPRFPAPRSPQLFEFSPQDEREPVEREPVDRPSPSSSRPPQGTGRRPTLRQESEPVD